MIPYPLFQARKQGAFGATVSRIRYTSDLRGRKVRASLLGGAMTESATPSQQSDLRLAELVTQDRRRVSEISGQLVSILPKLEPHHPSSVTSLKPRALWPVKNS